MVQGRRPSEDHGLCNGHDGGHANARPSKDHRLCNVRNATEVCQASFVGNPLLPLNLAEGELL